jgi:hypothetical protein
MIGERITVSPCCSRFCLPLILSILLRIRDNGRYRRSGNSRVARRRERDTEAYVA